jgi:DNA repair photolyase
MLVGIAKLAQSAKRLEVKRRVEYRELPSRRLLNRCSSPRVPFDWTINPYRGCEFGCRYCYARYTHEFMELRAPEDFETRIFAKQFDEVAFQRELRAVRPGGRIALGTATDPWQPAERRYGITRKTLEALLPAKGLKLLCTTKSDLVARDAALLKKLGERNEVKVNLTITTVETRLARLLEPGAPRPDLRLRAVAELARAGVAVGVFASPVLPGLNDSSESLEAVASGAAAAGALWFGAQPLFLKPCAKAVMLPFLDREFPELGRRYRVLFRDGAYLRGAFEESVRAHVAALKTRYGFRRTGEDPPKYEDPQLSLFPEDGTIPVA